MSELVTGDVGEARKLARALVLNRMNHWDSRIAEAEVDALIEAVRVEEKALAASDRHQAGSTEPSEPSERRERFTPAQAGENERHVRRPDRGSEAL